MATPPLKNDGDHSEEGDDHFLKNIHKYSMAHSKRVLWLPGYEAVLKQYQHSS